MSLPVIFAIERNTRLKHKPSELFNDIDYEYGKLNQALSGKQIKWHSQKNK